VPQYLLEHKDDLQHNLIILLLGLQQFNQRYNHFGATKQQSTQLVAGTGAQVNDGVQYEVIHAGTGHQQLADPWYQLEVLQDLRVIQIGQGQVTQNAQALHYKCLVIADGQNARQIAHIVDELQLQGFVLREIPQQLHQQGILVLEGPIHQAMQSLALHHNLGISAIKR